MVYKILVYPIIKGKCDRWMVRQINGNRTTVGVIPAQRDRLGLPCNIRTLRTVSERIETTRIEREEFPDTRITSLRTTTVPCEDNPPSYAEAIKTNGGSSYIQQHH